MPDPARPVPPNARVVVIGGGAVGCSVLYHLALAGWRDCVLLEKNELTSGSTWHAAGNCPNFAGSWSLLRLQGYSTELYRRLGETVGYPINYHVTGSLRLAHSRARMQEFRNIAARAGQLGMEMRVLEPARLRDYHPYLELHDLAGGLWDPTDGDIDPAQLTQAFAKGARDLGQRVERFCALTGVQRDGEGWRLDTSRGEIRCDTVVNAAGYRAAEVGRLFGREVPSAVLAHQYLVTGPIDALAGRAVKLPLLRDPDTSYYLRQEVDGLLLGPYEHNCRLHWQTPDDPMPDDFSFQLYADDLDRLEDYIADACARVPLLGSAGVSRVVNGPIPYTPDGLPLIGPMPGVANAFEACVFTFGIVQAGGAGKLCADWIVNGLPDGDAWDLDPRRFTDFATADYVAAKAEEVYSHEYAIQFPHRQWPAGRPALRSPAYPRLAAAGAEFGSYGGWERADWFPADDERRGPADGFGRQHWFDTVGAECRHVAGRVGLIDLSGFSRYRISGAGSAAWLDRLCSNRLPAVGRMGLCYCCAPNGRLITEMMMVRLDHDRCWLLSAAAARWHDRDWLARHLPSGGAIQIDDISADWSSYLVTGPHARAVLETFAPGDYASVAFPWLSHRPLADGDAAGARLLRVSYAGELGWEVHAPAAQGLALYDRLLDAGGAFGLRRFGMLALDSLRLEKAYLGWKSELSSDYTPLELGLGRWVRFDKDYIGKDALAAQRRAGPRRRLVVLGVDQQRLDRDCDGAPPAYLAAVSTADGRRVGQTLSSGYGHRLQKTLALAMLEADAPAQGLSVDVYGTAAGVTRLAGDALYDPDNGRQRG